MSTDTRRKMKEMTKMVMKAMTELSETVAASTAFAPNSQTEAAEEEVEQKISEIMSGRRPPHVSYDDGDQSPLYGDSADFLRTQWSMGMDYVPYEPMFVYLSPWLKVIFSGDYDSMMKMLKDKSEAEVKKLISRRETLMNVSAIFHVIIGARTLADEVSEDVKNIAEKTLKVRNDHLKILEKLISLGADVNVRDVAGFTPLHHCAQYHANRTTLEMADILINAGAKVDAQNRFGETPLMNCTQAHRYDLIKFFTERGADGYIKENDGISPFSSSRYNPKSSRILTKAKNREVARETDRLREEAGGSLRKCSSCGATEKINRCTGCYFVWYCGRDCQEKDWPNHRDDCKKIKKEFVECVTEGQDGYITSLTSGKVYIGGEKKLVKNYFVLKIQIPIQGFGETNPETGPILVQNKNRSYMARIGKEKNPIIHNDLTREIKRNGVQGLKGYFMASLHSDKLRINVSRILPPENW